MSLVTNVPNVPLSITDSPIVKLACVLLTAQKTIFATPTLVIATAKVKPLVEITAKNAQPDILDTPIVTVITKKGWSKEFQIAKKNRETKLCKSPFKLTNFSFFSFSNFVRILDFLQSGTCWDTQFL